ncbi:MAG: NUDIX hydrolase [Myxococcaceae bacterium]|nr:NUDIX hydrolase [Myxococcaceae bacterium]
MQRARSGKGVSVSAITPVTAIEIVEDFSSTARCDEGFLQIRRLRARNLRSDGTHSAVYRIDVVDRPKLDAVAVLVWRRGEAGLEFLTRQNLRPAAYFRAQKTPVVPDLKDWLFCEEIVAGLLEPSDSGERAIRARAAEEVLEEAGLRVEVDAVKHLGNPFFVAPGIISEKIFLTHVEVTGLEAQAPAGDGSPLEEGGRLTWRSLESLHAAFAAGEIQDAKTELALNRFLASQR